MTENFPKLTFIASDTPEAQKALTELNKHYDDVGLDKADMIIALGGDGTILEVLHQTHKTGLPVYGMNCGSVGFLLNPYRPESLLERLNEAHHVDIFPLHMSATDKNGETHEALAFNEVSLLRETRQAAKLKISVDNIERIPELVCDGILLSTPAGSTAYNLSAHGPIIPLSANLLALTPISAFRPRRWRGALLPYHSRVKIEALNDEKRPVSATADSTEIRDIQSVEIRQLESSPCRLLFDPDHNLEERILKEQFMT
ncbi:MAG: NAD kinase [Alphaproteobacteria bacterium]|nr:NAD kinase [Alphaproteobacteria bacterium]